MRTFECTEKGLLPHVVMETNPKVTVSILWLHGLGADGYDFAGLAQQLSLSEEEGYRFVLPHAPYRAVTLNGGMQMRAWFDVDTLESPSLNDVVGMRSSSASIMQLLKGEIKRGIPPHKVILGGFSQGGALALEVGLSSSMTLGGMVGLSTYLPSIGLHKDDSTPLPQENNAPKKQVPIFMAHGTNDMIVPYKAGERSMKHLQETGHKVTWRSYDMEHAVCPAELKDVSTWIKQALSHE